MDFFSKLSVALCIWAGLLLFAGLICRPFSSNRRADQMNHLCDISIIIGLICGVVGTTVAVFN